MINDFEKAKLNFQKGNNFFNKGFFNEAELYFETSLKFLPNRISTIVNLILCKLKLKKTNECAKLIEFIEKHSSFNCDGIYARALYYGEIYKFDKSIELFEKLLKNKNNFDPNTLSVYYNCIAVSFIRLGNFEKSRINLKESIKFNSKNYEALFNLGTLDLRLKNFKSGWKNYEYRIEKNNLDKSKYPLRIEDIKNKNILIVSEQGFGDTIQFSALIPSLLKYTKNISFYPHKKLNKLFEDNKEIKIVNNQKGECDFVINLMSLPYYLKLNLKNPDLKCIIGKKLMYQNNKKEKLKLKNIGIAWSSSSEYQYNDLKSIPLKEFQNIFDLKKNYNLNFFCMQKDIEQHDLDAFKFNKDNLNYIGHLNFEDLSKKMKEFDLVISNDTVFLHLSCALGIKTIALLPEIPDWRWMDENGESSWYKNLKILRLSNNQSWSELIQVLHKHLCDLLKNKI